MNDYILINAMKAIAAFPQRELAHDYMAFNQLSPSREYSDFLPAYLEMAAIAAHAIKEWEAAEGDRDFREWQRKEAESAKSEAAAGAEEIAE